MCTVQSIKDAIRENCQSQYDMESTDIDRVLQTLPFSGHESLFDQPPLPKRPYRPPEEYENQEQLNATVFFTKDCGFFHALKLERSEVNGRFSH